jgi:hypothetical protein
MLYDISFYQDLIDFLSDNIKLKQNIKKFISFSRISKISKNNFQTYTC